MITVVPAQRCDIPQLLALEEELILQYEDRNTVDLEKILNWCSRKLEKRLNTYHRILCDETPVGFYALAEDGPRFELDSFYILPEYRNQGIGTQVLKHLQATAEKPMYLYVFTANRRAMALYHRMGFREIEVVSPTRRILQWDPA